MVWVGGGGGTPLTPMDKICIWNVRGLNSPRKQKEILRTFHENKIGLCGLIETKWKGSKAGLAIQSMFQNWSVTTNFSCHKGGRILLAWCPNKCRKYVSSNLAYFCNAHSIKEEVVTHHHLWF